MKKRTVRNLYTSMTEECISIQGDSGHAQVNMVTDVYSHILDDDRRKNAELDRE